MPAALDDGIFVVGAGRLGRSLIAELVAEGLPIVGAWNRTAGGADLTRNSTEISAYWGAIPDLSSVRIVFITVPDRAIPEVARRLVEEKLIGPEHVLLHCSGALPAEVLRVADGVPAAVGSWHPLKAFGPRPEVPSRSHIVSLEGEPLAVEIGSALAERLGHQSVEIPAATKSLYHAAATIASNYQLTVCDAALDLFCRAGLPYPLAVRALADLVTGALKNLGRHGPVAALTGPVARGDCDVVARHLEALWERAPELQELYRVLGRYTLALVAGGGQSPPHRDQLYRLLLGEEE